jgi:hypothetical protein
MPFRYKTNGGLVLQYRDWSWKGSYWRPSKPSSYRHSKPKHPDKWTLQTALRGTVIYLIRGDCQAKLGSGQGILDEYQQLISGPLDKQTELHINGHTLRVIYHWQSHLYLLHYPNASYYQHFGCLEDLLTSYLQHLTNGV